MTRVFWVALGASAGVLLARSVRTRAADLRESLTPGSLLGSLVESVTGFLDDVRDGMAEREEELRDGLGLDEQP